MYQRPYAYGIIWRTLHFLSDFRNSNQISEVSKAASPSCPSDFRPITIVSVFSKGFERLINGQVLAHFNRSELKSEFQSGFRCVHSTTTALVRVIEDLRSSMTVYPRILYLHQMSFEISFLC
jgi:hypothetical protein